MAVNLSLFYGVPCKKKDAIRQFNKLKKEERGRPFFRGRYLLLKKNTKGKYRGCFSTYIYETKPQLKGIKITKIK